MSGAAVPAMCARPPGRQCLADNPGPARTVAGMARHQVVNAVLANAVAELVRGGAISEAHVAGMWAALGVPVGTAADPREHPVLGFHVTCTDGVFCAYLVTPGRFVRYEVAGARSLTVALPMHKVSRVVEEADAERVAVTVELDADAVTIATEYLEEVTGDGQRQAGRSLGKARRTTYQLVAASAQSRMLATFSQVLRSTIGQ